MAACSKADQKAAEVQVAKDGEATHREQVAAVTICGASPGRDSFMPPAKGSKGEKEEFAKDN